MNVTIMGAGNQGVYLAVLLSSNGYNVKLYTNKNYGDKIFKLIDIEGEKELTVDTIKVVSNIENAIKYSEYIFITYPMFLRRDKVKEIKKYIKNNSNIVFVPNGVGSELLYNDIKEKNIRFIGLERVPAICRLKEDNCVVAMSRKKSVLISSIPKNDTIQEELEKMLSTTIEYNPIYLATSFTSSNPILHPSRIYNLFKWCDKTTVFDENIKFYASWNDDSSKTLINCDDEMRKVLCSITNNKYNKIPVTEHYDSVDFRTLTKKIRSIESFKNIYAPLKKIDNHYTIDLNSRYFKEDFEYGLCTYKGYALLCGVKTPHIDNIIYWYQNLIGKEYIKDGNLGNDYKETGMPQAYGITKIDQLKYLKQ